MCVLEVFDSVFQCPCWAHTKCWHRTVLFDTPTARRQHFQGSQPNCSNKIIIIIILTHHGSSGGRNDTVAVHGGAIHGQSRLLSSEKSIARKTQRRLDGSLGQTRTRARQRGHGRQPNNYSNNYNNCNNSLYFERRQDDIATIPTSMVRTIASPDGRDSTHNPKHVLCSNGSNGTTAMSPPWYSPSGTCPSPHTRKRRYYYNN